MTCSGYLAPGATTILDPCEECREVVSHFRVELPRDVIAPTTRIYRGTCAHCGHTQERLAPEQVQRIRQA